jgi:hypothetical protein
LRLSAQFRRTTAEGAVELRLTSSRSSAEAAKVLELYQKLAGELLRLMIWM